MGFYKDVAYDMSRGMSKQTAIKVNAILRSNTSVEAKQKAFALGEADVKLNTMI